MPSIIEQLQDPATRLLFDRVVKGEAGDSPDDMRDVIGTIFNRARMGGQSLRDVLLSKGQFTSVSDYQGNARDRLGGLGLDALSTQNTALDQALQQFDPNTGTLKDFDPNVVNFYQPAAQAMYHKKDPQDYQAEPGFARGKKPTYTGSSGQQYYEGSYSGGGRPSVQDLAQPQAAGQPGQPPGLQLPQLSPEDDARVKADLAQRRILAEQQMANYDKQSGLIDQEIKDLAANQKETDGYHDRFQASMKQIVDSMPDEHKMEMEELRKVSPDEPGNPTRALKQFLPMLVMVGGMFARGGGIGAMNAAAQAVNAARSHDEEALKKAHQDFQDQLTETLDKATMAHDMLTDGLAKAGGDKEAILQTAQLVGAQLGMPGLKMAALDGDINAVMSQYSLLTKATMDGLNFAQKSQKLQMDALKFNAAVTDLQAGRAVTPDKVWTLAVSHNQGMQLPPMAWSDSELKRKILDYSATALEHPNWDGPWGIGPMPAGWKDGDPLVGVDGTQGAAGGQAGTAPGLSPTQAGVQGATVQADVKADRSSLAKQTALADASQTQERAAIANFDRALSRAPKGVVLNWGPWVEDWVQRGAAALGNKDVPPYWVDILTAADEYAKIISGATGAAGSTDTARKQAIDMFKPGYTVEQMRGAIDEAKQDMSARVQSNVQARDLINQRLNNERGAGGAGGGQSQGAAAETPPPPTGLQPAEKATWVKGIETMQQHMRNGTASAYYKDPTNIRNLLREQFKDATDAQIDAGVRAVMGAGVGGNRPNAAR